MNVKEEDNFVSFIEVKLEPEDFLEELKTEPEEFENVDIKAENETMVYSLPSMQFITKGEEDAQGVLGKEIEDYNNKSQDEERNDTQQILFPPQVMETCIEETQCMVGVNDEVRSSNVCINMNVCSDSKTITSKYNPLICDKTQSRKTNIKGQLISHNESSLISDGNTNQMSPSYVNHQSNSNNKVAKSKKVSRPRFRKLEKTYTCDVCRMSFYQKCHLTEHSRIHSNEKPFKCNYCNSLFSQQSSLTRHIRIHTNEKPFKCNFCEVSFSQKYNLTVHNRIHTKEKPFQCNVCNLSFTQKYNLIDHTRIHTKEKPFKCDFCDLSFSRRANLIRHTRTHTSEKPFKCDICESSFSQKITLVSHVRCHTYEEPFKCDLCDKSFCHKFRYIEHLRNHEPN